MDKETDPTKKINLAVDYAQELLKCGRAKECIEMMASITKVLKVNNFQLDNDTKRNLYSIVALLICDMVKLKIVCRIIIMNLVFYQYKVMVSIRFHLDPRRPSNNIKMLERISG
jgi:hypothetical protein